MLPLLSLSTNRKCDPDPGRQAGAQGAVGGWEYRASYLLPREFTSPKHSKVRATSDLRIHLFYSLHFSNQETLLKHANVAPSSRLICCELRNESSAPDTLIWLRDDLGSTPLFSVFFLPPQKCYCKIVWGGVSWPFHNALPLKLCPP